MDLKIKDNSKLRLAPFTQLEYIDANGACDVDTGIVVNSSTSIMQSIMQIGPFPSERWLYSWIFGTNSTAFGLGWDANLNTDRPITLFPDATRTSFNFPRNERHDIEIYNNNGGKLKYDGELILSNSTQPKIPNNQKFHVRFGGSLPFRYYRVCVKQSDIVVLDLYPAKDSRDVICFYDTISETFFYNQGTGKFVAGPEVPSIITGLPNNILLKTTTLYHKNTPNVNGLQFIKSILDYQKTHQDEVKEYYYPTTQVWKGIVAQYPEIVPYYNQNHMLCVVICDAEDPAQCVEDFFHTLEVYPSVSSMIAEFPSMSSVIAEWNPIVHSLVDTGYENTITSSGTRCIDTGFKPNQNTKILCTFDLGNNFTSRRILGCGNGWNDNAFSYGTGSGYFYFSFGNTEFKDYTLDSKKSIEIGKGIQTVNNFESNKSLWIFGYNYNSPIIDGSAIKFWNCKIYDNGILVRDLVPFYHNGNYGMLDIHNLNNPTFCLNVGAGEFTYSLEQKNA